MLDLLQQFDQERELLRRANDAKIDNMERRIEKYQNFLCIVKFSRKTLYLDQSNNCQNINYGSLSHK